MAILEMQHAEIYFWETRQCNEREMWKADAALQHNECKQITVVLKKLVDVISPELDPTECYIE